MNEDPNVQYLLKRVTVECTICGAPVEALVGHAARATRYGKNLYCDTCREEAKVINDRNYEYRRRHDPARWRHRLAYQRAYYARTKVKA